MVTSCVLSVELDIIDSFLSWFWRYRQPRVARPPPLDKGIDECRVKVFAAFAVDVFNGFFVRGVSFPVMTGTGHGAIHVQDQ